MNTNLKSPLNNACKPQRNDSAAFAWRLCAAAASALRPTTESAKQNALILLMLVFSAFLQLFTKPSSAVLLLTVYTYVLYIYIYIVFDTSSKAFRKIKKHR